jgi:hypothetical protein
MKNQYYGDINDYRKYGLLRQFQKTFNFKIGIIWMLTEDDTTKNDGNKIRYLKEKKKEDYKWEHLDPELFNKLKNRVDAHERDVKYASVDGLISSAKYFPEKLNTNIDLRHKYFSEAFDFLNDSDLIFFDPDMGLQIQSVGKGNKDSEMYLYMDEFEKGYDPQKEYLIYQHFPHEKENKMLKKRTEELLKLAHDKRIVSYSTDHVAFIYLSNSRGNIHKISLDLFHQWNDQFNLRILTL